MPVLTVERVESFTCTSGAGVSRLVITTKPITGVTLTESGPVTATSNGQIIENLRITSSGANGITVNGRTGVVIRNVEIRHTGGRGIYVTNSPNTQISYAKIIHEGAPASGQNSSSNRNNIEGLNSTGLVVTNAQLWQGSSGIYTIGCSGTQLSFIEGHDFRGPFPRGQIVQFDSSPNSSLSDFYNINPNNLAWTEDNVNIYKSSNVTISRGLIDGNNSPSGIGVIVEALSVATASLIEDVDTIRMGNGSFSAASAVSSGPGSIFRRCRARENVCGPLGNGRSASLSNSLMFASWNGAQHTRYEQCSYWASCNGNISWDEATMDVHEFTQVNYTQRVPLHIVFPWE